MKKLFLLKSLLLLCALMAGSGSLWAEDVTGTITFGKNNVTISSASATGNDSQGNTWTITTDGTTSFTSSSDYYQVGSSKSPATSITFTTTLAEDVEITAFSAKFGGFSGTAGTITLKVGDTSVGTGSLNATSDVTVSNTSSATGKVLTVTVTDISKGVKCYNISYTYSTGSPTKVATPTISGTQEFLESTEVTITCSTDGSTIQYSTDGGTNWTNYSAPFTLTSTTTVTAKATADGLTDSDEASKTFTKVTPMTVTEAIAYIDEGENLTDQYVTGKISQIDSYSSGSITYWISEDGTTTTQMEVYKGKGIDGASFSAVTDLEVGDEVVVNGTLQLYGTTYEFSSGSKIISRTEKPASDLTKTADITLDFKNGATDADLTDFFTTSSTGAITYTVADETVIERADELISALKVGTTTVTVSQAATIAYKAGEITINVTVQDSREAATTIPAINISTLKVGDEGTVSVSNPVKADDGVTFSYVSSNDDVLLIVGDAYEAEAIGTVTVTVTATPSDTKLYTSVVETFEVTVEADVKTDTEIILDTESGSTVYGTPKSVDYAITDGYNGTMSYSIDNNAIADVEIGASAITFTPKAVGTAVIAFSAPATATFNAAEDVTYTLTVTAPTGGTTAAESGYNKVTSTSELTDGDYLIVYEDGNLAFNGGLETLDAVGNSVEVTISENTIASSTTVDAAVFSIAAIDGGYSIQSASGKYIGQTSDANGLVSGTSAYTNTISFDGSGNANIISGGAYLRYNSASNQTRFRYYKSSSYTNQKAIQLYKNAGAAITATLNGEGYATFCSQYSLDFTEAEGYTAWQITDIDNDAITFAKVTGSVKGGTGLLLKGEAGATVTLASVNSTTELGDNLLEGTLAPTYSTGSNYYGLSGKTFVPVGAGTVPAGKALLSAEWIPTQARQLSFIFEDETTGITDHLRETSTNNGEYFNLAGQRVAQPAKGLYIVNGKKVVIR